MTTNQLYDIAEKNNIHIQNFKLQKTKSTSINIEDDYYIGIDDEAMETTAERNTHIGHELGHCMTGSFYNMFSEHDIRSRHEYRADKWSVQHLVPKDEFIDLLKQGYERWDLAEHFDVTEELINKAYHFYCEIEIIENQ